MTTHAGYGPEHSMCALVALDEGGFAVVDESEDSTGHGCQCSGDIGFYRTLDEAIRLGISQSDRVEALAALNAEFVAPLQTGAEEVRVSNWLPLGKYVLVKLHTQGSALLLEGDVQYNGLATVLAVGDESRSTVDVGDTVLLNGPQGLIAHKELGEHIALVAAALVLAKRVDEVRH